MQSTQITQPGVVVLHDVAVKGVECGRRWIGNWPPSMHQAQQHVNGTEGRRPLTNGDIVVVRTARRAPSGWPLTPKRCRRSNPVSDVRERGTTAEPERNIPRLSGESAASRSPSHRSVLE